MIANENCMMYPHGNFNMADIQFYQEDSEDGQDDEGDDFGLEQEYEESPNPDEGLTPLQKVQKYMSSENIYSRQMVARSLLDTIRLVRESGEDPTVVLQMMVKLSEDSEPSVRTELMEQVPHIAMFCQECPDMFSHPVSTYILPVIVKYLMDNNNLVRKTSQAALLVLMEQGLIDNVNVEEHVCPVINELSSQDSMDDFRTEAVALMSKMAPLVGRDITERLFMPRFAEMCTDALFHVRKVCAANFGDMCNVVGQENTEHYLLTKFYYLCEDGVWGVRKACAECFTQVSCACSQDIRRTDLTQLFVGLVCDQSRWVRMAAFQCLGSFISTFADSSVTGLYLDEEGVLTVGNPEDFRRELSASSPTEGITGGASDVDTGIKAPLATEDLNLTPDDMDIDEDDEESPKKVKTSEITENASSGTSVDPQDTAGTSVDVEESPEEKRAMQYEKAQQHDGSSESIANTALSSDEAKTSSDIQISETESESSNQTVEVGNRSDSYTATVEESASASVIDNTEDDTTEPKTDDIAENPANTDPWADENIGGAHSKKCHLSLNIAQSSNPAKCDTQAESESDLQSPESFSSFIYWRDPLPEIDLETDLGPSQSDAQSQVVIEKNIQSEPNRSDSMVDQLDVSRETLEQTGTGHLKQAVNLTSTLEEIHLEEVANLDELNKFLNDIEDETNQDAGGQSVLHVANEKVLSPLGETVTNIGSVHVLGEHVTQRTMTVVDGIVTDIRDPGNLSYCPIEDAESSQNSSLHSMHETVFTQDVIPQELLEHYLSMTDPSRAQTVDAEIARHCAYSFPAVAYTLGRKNWNCLRDLYDTLAGDMQWKVRRTLAFSIHELALILGEEMTTRDLVPIFNGFLRDLDEVRIGVLKHFSDFLRLLSNETRREYLPKISEFLNTDNNRNWRFRDDLAQQLILLLDLYSPEDISESLIPVAFTLCQDGVSAVRLSAFAVVAGVLSKFNELGDKQLPITFVNDIVGRFAHNPKWNMRQYYAQMCCCILEQRALSEAKFAKDMLPSLLALGSDTVPNVRITLAKTLCGYVLVSNYFTSAQNPHHEDLLATVQLLKSDTDRDVRYFISYQTQTDISEIDTIPV